MLGKNIQVLVSLSYVSWSGAAQQDPGLSVKAEADREMQTAGGCQLPAHLAAEGHVLS